MARLIGVLMSGRRRGYTAGLLQAALESAGTVEGVDAVRLNAQDFTFGPCTSCFTCIRRADEVCILDDDMGRGGEGALFLEVRSANGLLFADPVHNWGPSATCHLFIERLYPFIWGRHISGMPFAGISCASNQGMHRLARANIYKWVSGFGMRYIDGLAAHCAYYDEALADARNIGVALAKAALADECDGREPMADLDRFRARSDAPWDALEPYIDNLTSGTGDWRQSLMHRGLTEGTFKREEARELLEHSLARFREALEARDAGDLDRAIEALVQSSAAWTHATWKEFLEEGVIGAAKPNAYRPMPDE